MTHDLIVIGAGPAGLSAALTGAELGLRVALLDEQPLPGGQIYRNVSATGPRLSRLLGPSYTEGRLLTDRLAGSTVTTHCGALVWDVTPDLTVTALKDGGSLQLRAPQLIAATGALERASPVPGWTLPGVMTAGAAQIALKASASIPDVPVVLAGSGPLLLLVACQLLDAGASVAGLVETAPAANRRAALAHLPAALAAPALLRDGLGLLGRLRRARLPWFSGASRLRVEGDGRACALAFESGGHARLLPAGLVLLHHGVVPDTQLSRLLRVEHEWSDAQLAWRPRIDPWGQTSLAGFRIAGDGAEIAGAKAAQACGALAALGAAHELGFLSLADRDARAAPLRVALRGQRRIRPFLDVLYRPPEWITDPPDETIVCRCEEVTAGRLREMVALGCQGPNQTKFFSRCGMGPCQGRQCGLVVTQVLARALGRPPGEVGAYRIRAPLKPVPLSALAALTVQQDRTNPADEH